MARTLCTLCKIRTALTGKGDSAFDGGHSEYCNPCYTEAVWENTHIGYGHEEILAKPAAEVTQDEADEMKGCWICFPHLNEATKENKARKGGTASTAGTRKQGVRRSQINHKKSCLHAQTPEARKACKNKYWTELAKAEAADKSAE